MAHNPLMDGVFFKIRVKKVVDGTTQMEIKRIPMLVVIGVTSTKQRVFLNIQQGDKDSATTWREIFKDLEQRGLEASDVKLGIMSRHNYLYVGMAQGAQTGCKGLRKYSVRNFKRRKFRDASCT